MSTTSISLGTEDRLTILYSYPNVTGDTKSLADTIAHWFGQTLVRDGCASASASVRVDGTGNYFLDLTGPDNLAASFAGYAKRLPQFLANGWAAWTNVVPMLQKTGKWDPCPDKPASSYLPWRFFLPHGMPMLNQKALLFFHYPPIRLLQTNQDYLDDPVPVRCEELLAANGVTSLPGDLASGDIMLFNTVMDATPIGAEDDQGSKNPQQCAKDNCPATAYDPDYGLIPIQYFPDYQKAQVSLLLNPSPKSGYTAPIVIYGAHPLATFNKLYGTKLKVYQTTVVTGILPGLKTPVLASSHPYVFYGMAQGFGPGQIGAGSILPPFKDDKGQMHYPLKDATAQMIKDLAVARWLKSMTDDPSQPVADVWTAAQKFWNDPAQTNTVSDLVQHQGSLWYYNLPKLDFKFKVPLSSANATKVTAAKPAAPAKPIATTMSTTAASVKSTTGLQVIGDNGTPVDWWFIYKVSAESQSPGKQKATGQEFLYFDSDMAAKSGAKPVLSKNLIDKSGALFDTYSQLFTPAAKANKDLGYFCYNDEDRHEPGSATAGTGPSPCGHCKGALAFDLASDSALWLIHSVPLLPMAAEFVYPGTGLKMAQTMLCIQLQNAAATKNIAQLMLDAHGPNVHVSSDLLTNANNKVNNFANPPVTNVPGKLRALDTNDPRLALMANNIPNNHDGSKIKPYSGQVPFQSKGGQAFLAIAKNRAWGDQTDKLDTTRKDFYDDLVSVALNENIEVETWENAGIDKTTGKLKIPPPNENGEQHSVENMLSVNLAPIVSPPDIPWSWGEAVDHAKLAISDHTNPAGTDRWVCVGDINFTNSMEKRGGGTCAFICEPLWNALSQILLATPEAKAKSSGAAAKKPAAPTKPAAKPSAAKTAAAKPVVAKKVAARKPVAKKKAPAKKTAPKKAAPKKQPVKKAAPKKKTPAKAASRKKVPSGKKTGKSKVIPKKKTAVKKAPAKKTAPKKAAPKKTSKKAAPKKPAAKAVKKKAAKKAGKKR
ncbi:deoxyribonuclease II family protein [Prosthecobacter sp.]|uniref:deoxyribonuclease II family protein n=1 Tax=Prosthecobacter sp. TaxID=1965333 RepID=UPI002ABC431B|nr:deoxyribonuclease II family protein [Prosthecobacter sp.]MDZ4401338.1 deoxyribonuclease II family protein [Prosthecobacter sp.]